MIINRPGYRPEKSIVVSRGKNNKVLASAYDEEGFAKEHVVADSQEEALLQLAGKLLDRLWAVERTLSASRGSVVHSDVIASYSPDE